MQINLKQLERRLLGVEESLERTGPETWADLDDRELARRVGTYLTRTETGPEDIVRRRRIMELLANAGKQPEQEA